jgi:transcriptional regulator with XRE-family HTH domain
MRPAGPVRPAPTPTTRRRGSGAGSVVRAARVEMGLTLAELGQRCGYSASQVSRYERGVQRLTDITLLRRLAEILCIPPDSLGLAETNGASKRHAGPDERLAAASSPMVGQCLAWDGGDDPVRRRELLAAAAGLASVAALGPPLGRLSTPASPVAALEGILYGPSSAGPARLPAIHAAVAQARADFQLARYRSLAQGLPGLIATAVATHHAAGASERATASTLLAESYIVAANFMVKLNDDPLAMTLADRALLAAADGDDQLTFADARRAVATALRRVGHRARARDLLATAAADIEPAGPAGPDHLSVYGTLLAVAAYTAAVDGDRPAAAEFITEAKATAGRLGRDANHRYTAFGPANVTLYEVSIAQVLGDSGTAIARARTIRPAAIPTAERQGRFWIDVARAYHQWRKPEPCYRALLAAERAAPDEVRYRPPVQLMTEHLLRADRQSLPGLRDFANRIALPAI